MSHGQPEVPVPPGGDGISNSWVQVRPPSVDTSFGASPFHPPNPACTTISFKSNGLIARSGSPPPEFGTSTTVNPGVERAALVARAFDVLADFEGFTSPGIAGREYLVKSGGKLRTAGGPLSLPPVVSWVHDENAAEKIRASSATTTNAFRLSIGFPRENR